MRKFKEFLKAFLKWLFRPISQLYNLLPQNIKKQFTIYNLQFTISVIILLIILTSFLWPKDKITNAKLTVARWPILPTSHFQMAKAYFQAGQEPEAKKEYQKALSSFRFSIGKQIFPWWQQQAEETKELIFKKEKIEKEIAYWEQILANKPNFRDLYLRLTLLYYQLWQENKAQQAWDKAFYLDPNNKLVQEIGKILNNK